MKFTFAAGLGTALGLPLMLLQALNTVSSPGFYESVSPWVQRLGWVLVHSTWQLVAVAIIAAFVESRIRHQAANIRYVAGIMALVAMVILPGLTWLIVDVSERADVATNDKVFEPAANRSEIVKSRNGEMGTVRDPMARSALVVASSERVAKPVRGKDWALIAATRAHEIDGQESAGSETSIETANDKTAQITNGNHRFRQIRAMIERRLSVIVAFWILGVILFTSRPICGLWTQWRYCQTGLSPVPDSVQRMLFDLLARMKFKRIVRVAESACASFPMVVG
jgi:hypothetical protein